MTTRTALDLHTDLSNIENYARQGNMALVTELLWAAESKMQQIRAHLDETRAAHGINVVRLMQADG